MRHKRIKRIFTRIIKGKQLVGFEVESHPKIIYLTGSNIKQNTKLEINEIEMLTGSYIRPDYYKKGEIMFNGNICEKDNAIIRDFWITLNISDLKEFRKSNEHKLLNFKEIKKIFTFSRNGKIGCGIKTTDDEVVFLPKKRLEALTNLEASEFHILESSYINPLFYKDGETMVFGQKCYGNNTVIKALNLRFSGNINQMHQNFEANEPNYYYSDNNTSNFYDFDEFSGPNDGYGGRLDDDFINDVLDGNPDAYWNID